MGVAALRKGAIHSAEVPESLRIEIRRVLGES
jgi:hypothetical protein